MKENSRHLEQVEYFFLIMLFICRVECKAAGYSASAFKKLSKDRRGHVTTNEVEFTFATSGCSRRSS